jgi:hypothetical protein
MATLRINRKALAAALAPLVLTGGILAPVASAAPRPAHQAPRAVGQTQFTRGFDVYNYTSHPLKFVDFTQQGVGDITHPEIGRVIQPGESMHMEATWLFLRETTGTAWFHPLDDNGQPTNTNLWAQVDVNPGLGIPSVRSQGGDRDGKMWNNTSTVTFKDAPNTEVTIGGDQGQKQADILKGLCDNGAASCTFNPTGETHILSDDRSLTQYAFTNPYTTPVSYTFSTSDAVENSNSLEISASEKVGLPDWLASAQVTLGQTYGHTWTDTHTFSWSFTMPDVPAHCTVTPTHKAPMLKDTGDFTVKLANTTWHLNDVTWLTPDTTKQALQGTWSYTEAPATTTQEAYAKANPPAGLIKRSAGADAPKCGD